MKKYNYFEAIKEDVKTHIEENEIKVTADNRAEIEEQLNDELFCDDSVTGNASGSYTYNTWQAEEYLCHNLDLLSEAASEFGYNFGEAVARGAETCDVLIRCYLLGQAIAEVLDEVVEEDNEE